MQLSGHSNDSLDQVDFQALSKFRNDEGPVFSLYLDLRSDAPAATNAIDCFENLLSVTAQHKKLDHENTSTQTHWQREADHIRSWLSSQQPLQGQGLVIFSSLTTGLWHAFVLPVPVHDRLFVDRQVFLRPLNLVMQEFNCALVVLADFETTRILKTSLGQIHEVETLQSMPVTGGDLESGLRQHLRSVVERTEQHWHEHGCQRLMIGGDPQVITELRDTFPESMRTHLAGELKRSPHVPIEEIQSELTHIEYEYEQRIEAQRVEELVSRAEENECAVLGLEQTLLAVRSKKTRMVIAEEDFQVPGGECPNCGFLAETVEEVCLICGVAMRPEEDIVEVALQRALDAGAQIEVLRSPSQRHALEQHGRIGALILDTGTPPVKDSANREVIAHEGKVNPEVLHDETVEESFPASDPPSW
jgi:hypothetical protein